MATGERKWASSSTRRGGMTFLGKVTVPKPINLPSQKLENHGMDPNVEIVPKGTLSWGSRSPASNPWGSSSLSFNTDNGRPSSGGSGTRPSTGGSEKAYESTANAWGSNSRPSSASGSLTSNHASGTPLRPRSADTRPGSSQLSRFAEPSTESSGAWAAAGSGDNAAHSKNEIFSLASGDFPILGSEKEDPPKNAHSSPRGGDAVDSERITIDNVDHIRRDNPPYEDGKRPNMEKWHGDALQRNPNMPGPPQHFAPWQGAPMGNPPGIWYSGLPGGPPCVPPGVPPYGPHGAPPYGPSGGPPYGPSNIPPYGHLMGPRGFPIEHPYYHQPMPAPPLGNSQPVPHHVAGSRGVHHGEMYRPSSSDGHFHPGISGMPMRPGFFPGPVPYEGYYPPPMGYCGPNDRDIPYLGPPSASAGYDRHLTPNVPEHVNSQSASGRHDTHEKPTGTDQGTSGHRHSPREQQKVILKQHEEDHEWEDSAAANDSHFEKGYRHRPSSHVKDQGVGSNSGEKINFRRTSNMGEPIQGSQSHVGSQFHGREKLADEAKSTKGVSNVDKNISHKVSSSGDVAAPKDSGLIKRIEGLNAKARGTDGKQDAALYFNRDEGKSMPHVISNVPHVNSESTTHYRSHGGGIVDPPGSHCILAGGGLNSSRKYSNSGPQIKINYSGKGKPSLLETDARYKNAHNGQFSTVVPSSKSDQVNLKVQDLQSNMIAAGKFESSLDGNDTVLEYGSASDTSDIQAQRAKKKEIAMQRAIQLQREEEDRIKEQKAKAQAKLEELNRRTQLLENSSKKGETIIEKAEIVAENAEKTSSGVMIDGKQEEAQCEKLSGAAAALSSNTIVIGTRTLDPQLQIPKDGICGSVTFPRQLPAERDAVYHKIDARGDTQHYEGKNNALKSKNKSYKDKQNLQHEKVASENTVSAAGDTLKHKNEVGEEVFNKVTMLAEPEVHHRAKSDKSGKTKHKVEDISYSVGIRSVVLKNSDLVKAPVDSGKLQLPKLVEATHGQPPVSFGDWTPSIEPHASQLKEDVQGRINHHSKHHSSHKQSRNHQGNRAVEKTHGSETVFWAPVKQHNQEAINDSSVQVVSEEAGDHIGKSDHAQSNLKNKRAEIERYVPKPVAKELAQQGSARQTTFPATNNTGSAGTEVETAFENKNVDNWQERAPRAQHHRLLAEASFRKGSKDNPHSVVSKDVHVPDSRAEEEKKFSDGWNSSDEWNASADKAPDATVPNFNDQETFNGGKKRYYKGSRNSGTYVHDREHSKGQAGKDVDFGNLRITISNNVKRDRTAPHKEHRYEGEQPSSYRQTRQLDSSADNRKTKAGGVHQNSGREITRFVKKEPAPHGDHFQSKDTVSNRPYVPTKTDSGSMASTNPQHDKRERKTARPQVGSNTRGQVEQPHPVELPVEHQHEQPRSSSGTRKNSNQNNSNVRAQEFQGEWNSFEHDRRHHNQTSSRGRARHTNSHYEYKPKVQRQPASASADGGASN